MKKLLNQEHEGFVMQLEVMATLFMMTVFCVLTLYILRVMNIQRYMNTVLTSTATSVSRWGGKYSGAYVLNVGDDDLITVAQRQINAVVAPSYHAIVDGTQVPNVISSDGQPITIRITYNLPPLFSADATRSYNDPGQTYNYGVVRSNTGTLFNLGSLTHLEMQITVYSIIKSGILL